MKARPFLLDVNVLLALAWPNHLHNREATAWFTENAAHRFRTCPLTQIGFVRISSNPPFTKSAAEPVTALQLLNTIRSLRGHEFWADDVELDTAQSGLVMGHRQVVDLYLMKLAASHGGVLATLDRGAEALGRSQRLPVELIN